MKQMEGKNVICIQNMPLVSDVFLLGNNKIKRPREKNLNCALKNIIIFCVLCVGMRVSYICVPSLFAFLSSIFYFVFAQTMISENISL